MDYSKYFPIEEYYNKFVIPINRNKYFFKKDKMLCPLHPDKNPSLGIIRSKSKGETCHCFGCNFYGNIVEFHQAVSRKVLKRYVSEDEAKKELCSIFKIDYKSLPVEERLSDVDKGTSQEFMLSKSMGNFDIGDFRYMIREGKRKNKGIAYFNTIMMLMVNEYKEKEE